MPCRTLALANCEWTVSVVAERRAGSDNWTLVAGFRSAAPDPRRYWVPLPISSPSRAAAFAQADAIQADTLAAALSARLGL
jgi:hypothetical protein